MNAMMLACLDDRATRPDAPRPGTLRPDLPRTGTLRLAARPAPQPADSGLLADADPVAEPDRLRALRHRLSAEAERLAREQPEALRSLFGL